MVASNTVQDSSAHTTTLHSKSAKESRTVTTMDVTDQKATHNPSSITESTSFFQPKLQVNKINDPYEVEADRVADEVTQSIYSNSEAASTPVAPPAASEGGANVQRLAFFQRKPAFESPTELDVNTASNPDVQRSAIGESVTTSTPPPSTKHQDEELAETETSDIQRKTNLTKMVEDREVDNGFESRLSNSKGGGSSLTGKTKQQMESSFGADFSKVRIHTNSNAVSMNNQVQAHAFTHGSDIYFNEGTYKPESKEGTKLLAHELTHVIQQG